MKITRAEIVDALRGARIQLPLEAHASFHILITFINAHHVPFKVTEGGIYRFITISKRKP